MDDGHHHPLIHYRLFGSTKMHLEMLAIQDLIYPQKPKFCIRDLELNEAIFKLLFFVLLEKRILCPE